jgi:hypothetical protein
MTTYNWRVRAYLIGGAVGALFGLASAYIYVQAAEKRGKTPELTPSDAVGLGLTVLGLLQRIATINEEDKGKGKKH